MIPCKNCIIIPVCRYKEYWCMLNECSLLFNFLYKRPPTAPTNRRNDVFNTEIYGIEKILKPTRWQVVRLTSGRIDLLGIEE